MNAEHDEDNNKSDESSGSIIRDVGLLLLGLVLLAGPPALIAQMYGMSPVKALWISLMAPKKGNDALLVLVWLVTGVLLLRRPQSSRLPLLAIGGFLAVWMLQTMLTVLLINDGARKPATFLILIYDVVFPICNAACWILLAIELVRRSGRQSTPQAERLPSVEPPASVPQGETQQALQHAGLIIVGTCAGAACGFVLNVVTDDINASPFRLLIYIVGGSVLGTAVASLWRVLRSRK